MSGFQVATSKLHVNFHYTNSLNITPCLFSFLVFKIVFSFNWYVFVNEYICLNTHCYMYTSIIDRKICYEFNMATFYINYIILFTRITSVYLVCFFDLVVTWVLAFHPPSQKGYVGIVNLKISFF